MAFIDITIGDLGILSAEEVDVVITHDGGLFLPCLIDSGQLVLSGIGFLPVQTFVIGDPYIPSEIGHLVIHTTKEQELVVVTDDRYTGETGKPSPTSKTSTTSPTRTL